MDKQVIKINRFILFFLILGVVFVPSTAWTKTDIEFILDISGSMRKTSGGETQIESARKALVQSLQNIPQDSFVALRVYGHRVEQTDKTKSCEDTELVVPFGPLNKDHIKNRVASLNPKGYTPIAYSLLQSRNDFKVDREAKKVIILLSDGEETCGGNPVDVLNELKSQGFEVVVHTIGFNVDDKTRQQLQAIAKVSGGQYFDAKGATQLNEALEDATKQSVVIEKEKTTYGQSIRGGNSYETAVPIEFNKEYKLDHHQKQNEFDYFVINLKRGQEVQLELKTLEKGVSIRGGKATENHNPYAGIQLHNDNRQRIIYDNIIGSAHRSTKLVHAAGSDGKYYVLLGSTYDDMNKDHVTFIVTSTFKGDLGTENDAGDTMNSAMAIQPQKYPQNHLGGSDKTDFFVFDGKKADKYFMGIIPNDEVSGYYQIVVWDEFKQRVVKKVAKQSGSGLKTDEITLPDDGKYFIEVAIAYGDVKTAKSYTFLLKKIENTSP